MTREEVKDFVMRGVTPKKGVPCGLWMHFPESASTGNESVAAHNEYYKQTQVSIQKIMNEYPYQIEMRITSPKDWARIEPQEIEASFYSAYIEDIKRYRHLVGDDAFILATIHGVLVSACHATDGMGRFPDLNNTVTRHLKEDAESTVVGLEAIGETLERLSLACIEAGADGIYYAALGAEENRFLDQEYVKYVKPIEKKLLANVAEKGAVVLHVCKNDPQLTIFSDYPCHMVNWAEYVSRYSLEDGVSLFPGKRILGGFNNLEGVIFTGTDEELKDHVKNVCGRIGRNVLAIGADCTLPNSVPLTKIRTISDFCESL